MEEQTREIRQLRTYVNFVIIAAAIVFLQSVIKNYINEKWAKERNMVACIPDIETNYPGIYVQSAAHPINSEAKLQTFVESYVHLTRNENVIDFHKVYDDPSGQKRFDKARLNDTKWKAIYMSKGPEEALNKKRYSESSDMFALLEREKYGIIFLIDEILTFPVPQSMHTAVIVRGQFEAIYDSADKEKKNLPPAFLGYREIRYIVENSFPQSDLKEEWENKWGMFVLSSEERTLDPGEMKRLRTRSRELFLKDID